MNALRDDNSTAKDIHNEVREQYKDSAMSKAGRVAMDLNAERSRHSSEIVDLHELADQFPPSTHIATFDSDIKWPAAVLGVAGVFLQSDGFKTECYIAAALSSIV